MVDVDQGSLVLVNPTQYECPKHGPTHAWMQLNVWRPDETSNRELGRYCLECYAEALDRIGVCRVTEINR